MFDFHIRNSIGAWPIQCTFVLLNAYNSKTNRQCELFKKLKHLAADKTLWLQHWNTYADQYLATQAQECMNWCHSFKQCCTVCDNSHALCCGRTLMHVKHQHNLGNPWIHRNRKSFHHTYVARHCFGGTWGEGERGQFYLYMVPEDNAAFESSAKCIWNVIYCAFGKQVD
jgi:hypothetical protein